LGPAITFVTSSGARVTLGAAFAANSYAANNTDGDFTIKVRGGNRVGIAYDFNTTNDNSHLFRSSSITFNNLSVPNFQFTIKTLESSSDSLNSLGVNSPKLLLYNSADRIIASSGSAYDEITLVISDERLKENIYIITSSLDKVKQLRGVTFNWKNKERGEQEEVGVIAQDFLPVLPQILGKSGEYYTVNYSRIAPILIEAIKEQQVIIEHLKSRIEALENQT
jgi:hypothetical protein